MVQMMNKQVCKTCSIEKEITEFYRVSQRGPNAKSHRIVCKECAILRGSLLAFSKRDFLRDLKENNPCTDCGKFYPYYVTDYDHVRGTKNKDISDLWGASRETLLEEISKCDLVCANCHRQRTHVTRKHVPVGKVPRV